ncbi:4Fe-4S dicluster domain-containing protein [Shewanella abyssi]|uniref:4Fe-4S dicluster domain-containing protein n=1 Tax=Shewanella abyssi TaxID=311789 RepID=UPI0020100E77|nr:4Fe-4S dicluster domain-containing protein [Shewanella abyssi]MCL1050651.1 4Fe-4S dicluster domain-containing protein [Shewanella abyssi]
MTTSNHDTDTGRRHFLTAMGAAGMMIGISGNAYILKDDKMYIKTAGGALAVDLKKCMGCGTCMTTCSLVHHGKSSMSLSRIQIQQDSFAPFPDDIQMATCHQCEDAPCVKACPVNANKANDEYGFIRDIDPEKCIGCMQCIEACPYTPKRVQWNPETRCAQKCDLCVHTPFMNEDGGPEGVRACERVCPVAAIKFVTELPDAGASDADYVVNLRNDSWALSGKTIED